MKSGYTAHATSPWRRPAVGIVILLVLFMITPSPGAGQALPEADAQRLRTTQQRALETIAMLETYYADNPAMLTRGMIVGLDRENAAGTTFLTNKFARALVHRDQFIIGSIGSSVTAGHGNCAYDSYQNQLDRLLRPVMNAARVKTFEVRNAGQGGACGDSFRNQIFCTRHNVGDDIDLLHYSWTYFENGNDIAQFHEMVIRWALMMQRAPAVHILNTGGVKGDADCVRRIVGQYDRWPKDQVSARRQAFLDTYGAFGFNGLCLERGLKMNGKYPGKKWGVVGDGRHHTTRYGQSLTDQKRQQSLGVVFRNWHPGPLGFQYVADVFGYYYLNLIVRAVDRILEASRQGKDPQTLWPQTPRRLRLHDLPAPMACEARPEFCQAEAPPACLNLEVPTFGTPQITVLAPRDADNPYRHRAAATTWQHRQSDPTRLIPEDERHLPQCQHVDRCGYVYADSSEAGWLVFQLPRLRLGFVAVCGYGKNGSEAFLGNPDLVVEFDGKRLDPATFKAYPERNCVQLQARFAEPVHEVSGHLLAFKITAQKTRERVPISRVMAM